MKITPSTNTLTPQSMTEASNTQDTHKQKQPKLRKFIQFIPAFGKPKGRVIYSESNPNPSIFKPVVKFTKSPT